MAPSTRKDIISLINSLVPGSNPPPLSHSRPLAMKLLCDVCNISPATVICCADQASLCDPCDSKIHGANKLSGKHQRLALIHPPSHHHLHNQEDEHLPLCDICQDSVGYFFCLEDRALLCRVCDFSIHSTNSIVSRHKRFLMTGIRVALQPSDTVEREQTHSPSRKSSPSNTRASQLSHSSVQTVSKNIQIGPQNMQRSPPSTGKSLSTSSTRENITERKIAKSSVPVQQKPRHSPLSKHMGLNNEGFSKLCEKQMVYNIGEKSSKPDMGFGNAEDRIENPKNLMALNNGKESVKAHVKLPSPNNANGALKPFRKHAVLNNAEESLQPEQKDMGLNHAKETFKPGRESILFHQEEGSIKLYDKQIVPNCAEECFGIDIVPVSSLSKSTRAFDRSFPMPLEFQQQSQEIIQYSSKAVGCQRTSNDMLSMGGAMAAQTGIDDCSIVRKESISDYLTETVPGWKVDELFNFYSDTDTLHNFVNCGSRRPDASLNSPDSDLLSRENNTACFDQHLKLDRAEAQVPSMASPPTLSGIPRSVKTWGIGRSRKLDVNILLGCDDTLVVPDIGGTSSPQDSPPLKRRRVYMDLW